MLGCVSSEAKDPQRGDAAQRVWDVAGRAAGNTVSPGVSALLTIAGIPLEGAIIAGNIAGALTEEGIDVVEQLVRRRRGRVYRFGALITEEAGSPLEQVLEDAAANPRRLELLAQAVEGASRARDDWKVDLLAKVYVHGAADDDKLDHMAILLDVVRQLEVPHVRLLRLIAEGTPIYLDPGSTMSVNLRRITFEDPVLNGSFDTLAGKLEMLGLILGRVDEIRLRSFYTREWRWRLTRLGKACVRYLEERGASDNDPDLSSPSVIGHLEDPNAWIFEDNF
jgi:hypothetical protein